MSCKDIGRQQTARMGGGVGRGKRVGNESTSYRVAYNTKGSSPAVPRYMIESLMKVLPVGYKVEWPRDCSSARCAGRYLPF